jgi:AcrR family transcriptional regulator
MSSDTRTDGRRARRELGREAVIEALLSLLFEGHDHAPPELLADRAGVSVASVFRYFESLDDLRAQAVERYFIRYAHLFEIADIGVGVRAGRIRSLVGARIAQHRATEPVARVTRREARSIEFIAEALDRLRSTQIDQVRIHFAAELDGCPPAVRDDMVATIAVLTSFESWEQFRGVSGRTDSQVRRAWIAALDSVLP